MNWEQPEVYAAMHTDEKIRAASRSGGVFTALSDMILSDNGIVYGCVLSENFTAVHIRAESLTERNRMRGSKYIQSKLGDTFRNVQKDLETGKRVLFSGTSCQVAGLKQFLGKEYENLLCIDIVCHGVPSPLVWKKYLAWQEKKHHSKIIKVDFRNKIDFGWRDHIETLWFDNKKNVSSSIFRTLFYAHAVLRPCCYECPYKSIMHPGDITIADYWGIEKAAPELDDNKGVSLVLINNEVGKKALESIKDNLVCKQTELKNSMQPPLKAPFPEPENRERFWHDFQEKPFDYIAKKYAGYGFNGNMKKILRKIKRILKNVSG